jgi:hypothetical protein
VTHAEELDEFMKTQEKIIELSVLYKEYALLMTQGLIAHSFFFQDSSDETRKKLFFDASKRTTEKRDQIKALKEEIRTLKYGKNLP